ncbi:MAG: polysaccharide deacetylase family protein [Candidatus Electrothrix sp. GW3-4]|uniref:polysaccharide deacetylase family protein n=1 Tax=Candidatus Electrothrix sp. GW3-4 TaxID=3126740 RepID=UPI0030CEEC51
MNPVSSKGLQFLFHTGALDLIHALWPPRVTVLAYHRVTDPHTPGFDSFKANVSATPEAFAEQMDYVRKRFSVISLENLLDSLRGRHKLPANPLLITFDDGYRDNLENAFPLLQQRHMPAVIFLTTDHIGQATPFYWDLIAYCFSHTLKKEVELPLFGKKQWDDEQSRIEVMGSWLDILKTQANDKKKWAMQQLPSLLDVAVPENHFSGNHLNWDQVRTLVASGIEMGAHTQSHPILSRIPQDQVQQEIFGSKERIEQETGRPVKAFAYPNGLPADFNPTTQTILKNAGFEAAFTLLPGPTRWAAVQKHPLAIPRVSIHHKDTLPRFAAKLMGISKLSRGCI